MKVKSMLYGFNSLMDKLRKMESSGPSPVCLLMANGVSRGFSFCLLSVPEGVKVEEQPNINECVCGIGADILSLFVFVSKFKPN
uniref:Uncharacterized protein n=1 Tax=Nelumbo nucifera TaxID=4432 RepID=A0A822YUK2_NELNU|nr:TPA_asm: hypothetical protein HUJ06_005739 [Nelumbo nucifera]